MLSASGKIFGVISGLVFIGSVILFISGEPFGGVLFMGIAFLVSPVGLPALAGRLADALASAGGALRGFIAS